jgi:hypothetical protein
MSVLDVTAVALEDREQGAARHHDLTFVHSTEGVELDIRLLGQG